MNSTHHYEQLIEIFNSCFADEFNTRLIKGDDGEPIYLPADAEVPYNQNRLCSWLLCQRNSRDFALVYCRESAP